MEKWKDIPGYEGLYQASTEGQIRSSPGKITSNAKHPRRVWKSRILKGRGSNPKTGFRVGLWKNGKRKEWLVARLVALTWVPGYEQGMTVNHINGNRLDNRKQNLEWLSLGDNIRHGFRTGLYNNSVVPITLIYTRSGMSIGFASMADASKFLGKDASYISSRIKRGKTTIGDIQIRVSA